MKLPDFVNDWQIKKRSLPVKMTIREALLAMAYKEVKPGHWMKPIGYQSFTYHEEKNEWANWFLSAQGKISLWETKSFKDDFKHFGDYLKQLKCWECYTRTEMNPANSSEFHLRAIDI